MSLLTVVLALMFIGYFLFLTVGARTGIMRFGPAMVTGIAAGVVTAMFGAFGRHYAFSDTVMTAGSCVTLCLVAYALWSHRNLLTHPPDDAI